MVSTILITMCRLSLTSHMNLIDCLVTFCAIKKKQSSISGHVISFKLILILSTSTERNNIDFSSISFDLVVLKDVSYTVMTELLQFMYQGVVNVKHTELNSFMKIAQQLQIKGLATSSSNQPSAHQQSHHHPQKSPASPVGSFGSKSALENYSNAFHSSSLIGQKRSALDYSNLHSDSGTSSKKHLKRSSDSIDNDVSTESMENLSSEEGFPVPQISMIESGRFDLSNVKRENSDSLSSPGSSRNLPAPFNFDYSSK